MRWLLLGLAACLAFAAWWAWRGEGDAARASPSSVGGSGPELAEHAARPPPPAEDAAPVRVLRGQVVDHRGRPLPRVQVIRVRPGTRLSVYTDVQGRFALPLTLAERHVVEADSGDEFARERREVEGTEEILVRMRPAGFVAGFVEGPDGPLDLASVDLYEGERSVGGATTLGGSFAILDEPPRDVPLRVRVEHETGYLERPLEIVYRGEPIDLGTIRLARFSRIDVRLALPDGTATSQPSLLDPETLRFAENRLQGRELPPALPAGAHRVAVVDPEGRYGVVVALEIRSGQDFEATLGVPRGPLAVTGRVTYPDGSPARLRLRHGPEGDPAWSEEDGDFRVTARHGGLVVLDVAGVRPPEHRAYETAAPFHRLVVDADAPPRSFVVSLSRRVFVVASGEVSFLLAQWNGALWGSHLKPGGVAISHPLDESRVALYAASRRTGEKGWTSFAPVPLEVPNEGFAVVGLPP